MREKGWQVARPDESPGPFVDGIDQDERAAARRLCRRLKGADKLLCGESRKVELLESLGWVEMEE